MRLEYTFDLDSVKIPRFSVEATEGIGKLFTLATLVLNVLETKERVELVFHGLNPDDLRRADALEVVVGQGAKPGGGGMLLGHKITERVADMRDLPQDIDQRSACRHPDGTGPDDLEIKIP